jgi:Mg-chelatase subunit ChlD
MQIKQCGQEWSAIDFNKVTSISLSKQKKAFLNKNKNGEVRYPDSQDRIECSKHFFDHIQKAVRGETEMKGKRVGMADFTKQAIELSRGGTQVEKDLLNSQWRDNATQTGALGKMIAMVDVSGSMEGDPMHVAIALGIRIAEKSVIGKRVMTFSFKPTWVNLEPYSDFVSQVEVVKRAEWGMNTNFAAALDTILDAIIQNKMAPEDVQDMVLVVLSDMQMDSGDRCDKKVLYDVMKAKYEAAGIRVHGRAYKPPHILFWNLRSTSGFPSLSNQPNASMMSGFSPSLLNLFCEQGIDALQSCTPWSLLEKSLENERYKIMSDKFSREIEV